jgi:hypothetical protein
MTLLGVTDGSSASAGIVGELISSSVAIGSAVSLVTNTAKTVTSISLTAGDWDVSALSLFTGGGTTTVTLILSSISATTNTLDTTAGNAAYNNQGGATPFAFNSLSNSIPPLRVSLSSTTTYYLVAQASFGTSTCSGYGIIRARRMR